MTTNAAREWGDAYGREKQGTGSTFEFCTDEESLVCGAPAYVEHIGLAADLTVFNVALVLSCGFIDEGLIPLATAGTLVSSLSQRA
jgi:hypothetical protein